ncbi:MAG: hypothetical protein IIZ67_05930 [Bacilli bacterium]|nr:hypothetical protein [Bacilli bacterium]
MTITADTEISSLMNYEIVSDLCDDFKSKVDGFKETASSSINSELSAGLSGDNCLVAGRALLEESGTSILSSVTGIDTGITAKVKEAAKKKRLEELKKLKAEVKKKINSLKGDKAAIVLKIIKTAEDESRLADINKEIDKYEKKLDQVNAEIGKIG